MAAFFPAVTSSWTTSDAAILILDTYSKAITTMDDNDYMYVNRLFIKNSIESIRKVPKSALKSMMELSDKLFETLITGISADKGSEQFEVLKQSTAGLLLNMKTVSNMNFMRLEHGKIATEVSEYLLLSDRETKTLKVLIGALSTFWVSFDQMSVNNEARKELVDAAQLVIRQLENADLLPTLNDLTNSLSEYELRTALEAISLVGAPRGRE